MCSQWMCYSNEIDINVNSLQHVKPTNIRELSQIYEKKL